ncbi:RNAse P Rpr2/Rpp21/SNM1 subunit domain-containing protein [Phaeosphaeria sp. MPI-PUGE-AT-0046c]|nr:RNAse P Rpr2/Rpp21/SNM1 subunit domain-containing protein [Phaeosphaeria sp. MPI-PUGE-AT-0046c]
MSKVKPPKTKGLPSKHLHARTSFLYQAATYLNLQTSSVEATAKDGTTGRSPETGQNCRLQALSPIALELGSDLQQVSRKAQLRLAVDMKRTICKRCNTILVPGRTAIQTLENSSKNRQKPWADVLSIECKLCGGKKRFPIGAAKQVKKRAREPASKDTTSTTSMDDIRQTGSIHPTSTDAEPTTG